MNTIKFEEPDDETLNIFLNGENLGHYTHDFDGWEGMQRVQQLIRRVAKVMAWNIEEA
jgi:hypothetical protein